MGKRASAGKSETERGCGHAFPDRQTSVGRLQSVVVRGGVVQFAGSRLHRKERETVRTRQKQGRRARRSVREREKVQRTVWARPAPALRVWKLRWPVPSTSQVQRTRNPHCPCSGHSTLLLVFSGSLWVLFCDACGTCKAPHINPIAFFLLDIGCRCWLARHLRASGLGQGCLAAVRTLRGTYEGTDVGHRGIASWPW